MKKLLLSIVVLAGLQANAQQVLFEDSFEFYEDFAIAGVSDWTLTDVDLRPTYGIQSGATPPVPYVFPNTQVPKSFQVFNATTTVPTLSPGTVGNDWTARTGERHMVCFAAIPAGAVAANNDWLISPQIALLPSGNKVSFWAKPCNATFGLERFRVLVSATGTAVADFTTMISPGVRVTTPANTAWVEYTYDIPASFANQSVYIAINCVSNDQFGFAVDDFKVSADVLATQSFFAQNFNVYPNPSSDVLNINAKSNTAIKEIQLTDVNGRIVKTVKANEATSQVNISDLNSGVYFLKVTSDLGTGTTKVVKN